MNSCLNSVGAPSFPAPQAVASAPVTYDSTDSGPQQWPSVSVVMPVLNEERHLADAVGGVMAQDYAGSFEVILGLGPSTDDTDRIAAGLSEQDPRVRTVSNPTGKTAAGLNAAIAAVDPSSLYVIRVDGHSVFPRDYLTTAVRILEETGADNVGGVMAAVGTTPFEKAVACSMRSSLGVGSASFHTGGEAGPAPTVYLGAFRRAALARVGGYDERFIRSQDWEMNFRIRQTGGQVWFTPALEVVYRPRPSVRKLAKQFFEYGRWRRIVIKQHAGTASLRYLAPPIAVVGFSLGVILGVVGWPWGWIAPATYGIAVVVGGVWIARDEPWSVRVRTPLALATMHGSWGLGFLTCLTNPLKKSA